MDKNTSSGKLKSIAVVSAGVAIFFWLAPANTKDKVIGLATFATNERQCFNYHKKNFVDPESAYLASSYVWTRKDDLEFNKEHPDPAFLKYQAVVRVNVFAKNRMGGYVSEYVECPLVNGSFDEHAALMHYLDQKYPPDAAAPAAAP